MRKKDRRSAGMKRVSEIPNFMALVKIIMKLGLVWLYIYLKKWRYGRVLSMTDRQTDSQTRKDTANQAPGK